jgi:hypothetical protein
VSSIDQNMKKFVDERLSKNGAIQAGHVETKNRVHEDVGFDL